MGVDRKTKVGKYYLWMDLTQYGYGKRLKVAKSKSSKGSTLASNPKKGYMDRNVVSNGEKVYYVSFDDAKRTCSLMQANLATKKSTVVKKFNTKKEFIKKVLYAYGKYVYYESSDNYKFSIVRLDTKTKKTKVIIKHGGDIVAEQGRYICIEGWKGDMNEVCVYDCESGKLRIIDTNSNCENAFCFYKNKLYMSQHNFGTMSHIIYSYNPSGLGKKVFKKMNIGSEYTSGYFYEGYYYYETVRYQRMNLKTKKIQKISEGQYNRTRINSMS